MNQTLRDYLIENNTRYIRGVSDLDYDEKLLLKLRKNTNFEKVKSLNIIPRDWNLSDYQELIKQIVYFKNKQCKTKWRQKNSKTLEKKKDEYRIKAIQRYKESPELREYRKKRRNVDYHTQRVISRHIENYQDCLKEIKKQDYYKIKEKEPIRDMLKVDINIKTGLVVLSYINSPLDLDELQSIFKQTG
jgi:hypothetical protein